VEIYTISAVTRYVKDLLEADPALQDLWLEGEVSNFVVSAAGHAYFTLKDAASQLRCVLFRSRLAALGGYRPANGTAVIAHGRLSLYEAQGSYQLYVDLLQPEGVGALHLQFELLRSRLEQEGLFDATRKRPLPRFPGRIGVVTSPTGAVLHDIVTVLRRRYPLAELVVAPTLVQGEAAAPRICEAIAALDEYGEVDVMIVARGGGSLEELWPFNEESVARAIYASRAPVVTGIGHETDYTIADWVADLRAPTPSAAAELVAPDWRECGSQVVVWARQLVALAAGRHDAARSATGNAEDLLRRFSPQALVDRRRQQADDLALRARTRLGHLLTIWRARVEGRALQLGSLDPDAVLGRGYSICRRDGVTIRSVAQVGPGDAVAVRVSDGSFDTVVQG
jgi:exodeoxyribonuclease VII large subunit